MIRKNFQKIKNRSSKQSKEYQYLGNKSAKIVAISFFALFIIFSWSAKVSAIEEIPYKVIEKKDNFEIRQYSSHLLAETEVSSNFADAGSKAFGDLFRYIDGNNQSQKSQQEKSEKIEMTAPVIQQEKSEKIEMTAPVIQQEKGENKGTYLVSFVVPQKFTFETVPLPKNTSIKIKKVPEKLMASIRYSGWWSQDNYQKHQELLYQQVKENGYQVIGKPLYARYNAPFTLWFLRRNEILVEVEKNN